MLRKQLFLCSLIALSSIINPAEQMNAKNPLLKNCNLDTNLGNANDLRKFVDDCIKTRDGIRFRKRFQPLSSSSLVNNDDDNRFNDYNNGQSGGSLMKFLKNKWPFIDTDSSIPSINTNAEPTPEASSSASSMMANDDSIPRQLIKLFE